MNHTFINASMGLSDYKKAAYESMHVETRIIPGVIKTPDPIIAPPHSPTDSTNDKCRFMFALILYLYHYRLFELFEKCKSGHWPIFWQLAAVGSNEMCHADVVYN